jgi:hypothetical protein
VGSPLHADQILEKEGFPRRANYLESNRGGVQVGRRFTNDVMGQSTKSLRDSPLKRGRDLRGRTPKERSSVAGMSTLS